MRRISSVGGIGVARAARLLLVFTLAWVVGLGWVPAASAEVGSGSYYVDSVRGSDANPGTSLDLPWRTLAPVQARRFAPGDVINLARGSTWTGGLVIDDSGVAGAPITFRAYGVGPRPVLRNPGYRSHAVVVKASWVVLEGLLVRDASYSGIRIERQADHNIVRDCEVTQVGEGVQVFGSHNLVTGCDFHDLVMVIDTPGGEADYGAVGVELLGPDNEVSYNRFVGCAAPSHDYGEDGGAVELWGNADNSDIHHNWATGNHGFVEVGGGSARNVVLAYNISFANKFFALVHLGPMPGSIVENLRIENNTIVELTPDYHTIIGFNRAEPARATATLRNNIIYTNSRVSHSAGFTHDHNLYYFVQWGNLGFVPAEGERIADPQFAYLPGNDFHLRPSSPAIDSGVYLGQSRDYAGQALPMGQGPDLGALEYAPGEAPLPSLTPSAALTASPAPSATPVVTSTPVPSVTPVATATQAPSATPAATATRVPSVPPTAAATLAPVRLVLQQGQDGYAGQSGTYLNAWSQRTNYAGDGVQRVRQGDVKESLIRFDLSSVPAGAVLQSARLRLYVQDRTNVNALTVQGYPLARPWSAAQATWLQAAAGQSWASAGANGVPQDRTGSPAFTLDLRAMRTWVEADVTALVRQWLQDPAGNHGLVLKGSGGGSVEYGLCGGAYWDPAHRPQLELVWSR